MDKPRRTDKAVNKDNSEEEGAFEIIELAIDDIQVLTRAFNVINTICEELSADVEPSEEELHGVPDHMMH